ncbi:MAG: rRNA (guanine527-N7)-methyltransferase [Mycobacterium sp.]|jgi:16S rRNA (guanine527-N7)-methyltransferase|nr:rRNA (guanine527-N7)-methyltransferase [Mycobacterium sp.]
MFHVKHVGLAGAPPAAARVFGDNLTAVGRYAELLAGAGVERGLIGPREADILWDRHLLNSAAVGELIPTGVRVVDAGSGAGLPGIPLALARPDLVIFLVEPMLRRTTFLHEAIEVVGTPILVVRGRVEDRAVREDIGPVDVVVCRAVASLDKLIRWCNPLLVPGGRLLAIKGEQAEEEVARLGSQRGNHRARLGAGAIEVVRCGQDYLDPPVTVVVVEKDRQRSESRRRHGAGGIDERA